MKYIFYIAVFNAFFFALLLFQKKARMNHDNILIIWLLFLGLFIGGYSLYSHELFTQFNLLSANLISLFWLQGIFIYLYASRLIVAKQDNFNTKKLLHLLPFAAFNLYLLVAAFFPNYVNEIRIENVHLNGHPPLLFVLFLLATLLSGPFYFVLTLRLFKRHDINIFNNFSSIETIDLHWLRKLVIVFGIIWTALIIITVIHHVFNLFSMVFCTDGLFLALSVFVILIGYFGLKQKLIFGNELKQEPVLVEEKLKYSGSTLKEDEITKYTEQLADYLRLEKPYLDPELTLTQLASQLNISTHHLSQIINEQFQLNFFEYINQFRVEEVKSRMNDPKYDSYSLLGIAFDAGFNSKSAFNRVFKKITHQTPSQFKSALVDK